MIKTFNLFRDGKEILSRVLMVDIYEYIHTHHPYSVDHALKYEGYEIKDSE